VANVGTEASLARRSWLALRWSYAGALVRLLSQLVIQLALARFLGPQAYGQAAAALLVIGVGWLFADAGLGNALVQKPKIDNDDVAQALGWVLLVSLLIAAGVWLAAPWLARWWGDAGLVPLLRACGLFVPLQALSNLPASLMQRRLDMKRLQWIQTGGYVVTYGGLGLLMAAWGWGAWALVAAAGAHGAWCLVGCWLCERHTLRPQLHGDAGLRRFGLGVAASNLANWAVESLDRVLIGRLWGTAPLGEYVVAGNLARAPLNLLVNSAQQVAFASAARLQDDLTALRQGYLALLCVAMLLSAPLFALLAMHATALVQLLYGPRWAGAAPLFTVACAAVPALTLVAMTGPLLRAVGAVNLELRAQWPSLALLFCGLWWLQALPLAQAAWVAVVAAALRALFCIAGLAQRIQLRAGPIALAVLPAALVGGIAVGASALALQILGTGLPALLLSVMCAALLSLLLLRWQRARLLQPALQQLLQQRSAQSAALAKACRWLGWTAKV
jgi:O-antigen/teichoic acid export membrane protein